jgi:ribosomal protein S2
MKRICLCTLILVAGCERSAGDGATQNAAARVNSELLVVRWTGGGFTREYVTVQRCEQARDAINTDSTARLTYAEIAYRDDHDQPATKILNFAVALCVPA